MVKKTQNNELDSLTNPDKPLPGLDLGLGSLLEVEDKAVLPDPELVTIKQEVLAEVVLPSESQSEFEQLFNNSEITSLIEVAEKKLENQNLKHESPAEWVDAQSWWLLAQLEQSSFPPAVLEAPYDALLEKISQLPADVLAERTLATTAKAAISFADALLKSGNIKSALDVLIRASGLLSDSKNKQAVEQLISNRLQIGTLSEKEKGQLNKIIQSLGINGQSLFSVQTDADLQKIPIKYQAEANHKLRSLSPAKVFSLSAILLCMVLVIVFLLPGKIDQSTLLINYPAPELPVARLELSSPVANQNVSELDVMLHEMNRKVENSDSKPYPNYESTKTASVSAQNTSLSPAVAVANNQLHPTVAPKFTLNTSGPRESAELRDLRNKAEEAKTDSGTMPDSGTLVPGPAIPPGFNEFDRLRLFHVIRPTSLMTKPSPRSEPVAGLNVGDKVMVEAREGYWLRIVSKQGRIAYVLAEDVEPSS